MPNVWEVVTNKESSRGRKIIVGYMPVIVRRARTEINSGNYKVLQVLDLLNDNKLNFTQKNKEIISGYIRENRIPRREVLRYSEYYPAKALKNYMQCRG